MALRLRRGTEAQRTAQVVPFQEGELVYITDTKKLYVGDGTTVGGVPVDIANADISIDQLGDVDTSSVGFSPIDGQSLVWDSGNITWRPGNAKIEHASIGDLVDVDITSQAPTQGQVLKWSTVAAAFVPNDDTANSGLVQDDTYQIGINGDVYAADGTSKVLENGTDGTDATFTGVVTAGAGSSLIGDVTGSVYANDASLMVDSANKTLTGNLTGSVYDSSANLMVDASTGDITVNNLIMSAGGSVTGPSFALGTDTITAFTDSAPAATGWFNLVGNYDAADALRLTFVKTRGTIFSPTTVQDGDGIASLALAPYDGSTYLNGGNIYGSVIVDGGNISTAWSLNVRDGASATTVTAMAVSPNTVEFTSVPKVPAFADASARDAGVTNPSVGMIVVTGANFQGYTGSAWVNLN
jgi:hypothetical protein